MKLEMTSGLLENWEGKDAKDMDTEPPRSPRKQSELEVYDVEAKDALVFRERNFTLIIIQLL